MASIAIEHRRLTDRLSYQAQHDALTGLPNRFLPEDRLAQAIAYADRHRSSIAVLLLDLDGFKYVNDTLGHQAGDQVQGYLFAKPMTAQDCDLFLSKSYSPSSNTQRAKSRSASV